MTGDDVKPGETRAGAGAPAGDGPADHARQRLLAMLARLRRARDTPLQFEGNREALAREVLGEVLADFPADAGRDRDGGLRAERQVIARLNALLAHSLRDEWPGEGPDSDGREAVDFTGEVPPGDTAGHPLAQWLERLQAAARAAHPRALDLLELRVEGFDEHDISLRLGLGRRLVRNIARDWWMRWAGRSGEE